MRHAVIFNYQLILYQENFVPKQEKNRKTMFRSLFLENIWDMNDGFPFSENNYN